MDQENDLNEQNKQFGDLCDNLDYLLIQSKAESHVVLSILSFLLSRWLIRTMGDRESAVYNFRQKGIPAIESAITAWIEDTSTTIH